MWAFSTVFAVFAVQVADAVTLTATLGSAFASTCMFAVGESAIQACNNVPVTSGTTAVCVWQDSTALAGTKLFSVNCSTAGDTQDVTVATPVIVVTTDKAQIAAGELFTITARAFIPSGTNDIVLGGRQVALAIDGPVSQATRLSPEHKGPAAGSSSVSSILNLVGTTDTASGTVQFTLRTTAIGVISVVPSIDTGSGGIVTTTGSTATITVSQPLLELTAAPLALPVSGFDSGCHVDDVWEAAAP
jgi:hypothetical protein